MSEGIVTASYVGATILFILALGGLSNQETARRGNLYGMIGMAVALIATIAGVTGNMGILIVGLLVGGSIGLVLAKRCLLYTSPSPGCHTSQSGRPCCRIGWVCQLYGS